jgi:hypothetical protein
MVLETLVFSFLNKLSRLVALEYFIIILCSFKELHTCQADTKDSNRCHILTLDLDVVFKTIVFLIRQIHATIFGTTMYL